MLRACKKHLTMLKCQKKDNFSTEDRTCCMRIARNV